jgi:superfamily II DNA or RNA helicase
MERATSMMPDSVISDIEAAVVERGSLTKDEIVLGWDLTDDEYANLRRALVARGRVEAGPSRIGGFRAKEQRGRLPEERADGVLREGWEEELVQRLTTWFQHKELEELLGDLAYTVRESRRARGGEDRRGTKAELATALVVQHGIDLLANPEIRKAISRVSGVPSPEKWHPGKTGALQFVQALELPSVLSGLPTDEPAPSFEYLEGRLSLPPLEDFQDEVRQRFRFGIHDRGYRSIVTLPTGAGKTRVAVQGIRDWLYGLYEPEKKAIAGATVLWLAHTEELCEQACTCFRQVWHGSDSVAPLLLLRYWGGHRHEKETIQRALESPSVLVSTPQRIVHLLERADAEAGELVGLLRRALGLIIVDEAHRAAARSYRTILGQLATEASCVGLTATPFRFEYVGDDPEAGTRELKEIFRNLIEPSRTLGPNPRLRLQERRILAKPDFQVIETGLAVRMPSVDGGALLEEEQLEQIDRALAVKTDRSQRRLAILQRLVPLARDPGNLILYFGPSVRDAECMAFLFRERGIPAAVVSGATREATRRRLVERFKRAEIRVLCNCEVLATGFDAPRVTHVVVARPTVSQVLYEQMIGRGMRGKKFGGTDVCVILDCVDEMSGPVRPELGYRRFRRVWEQEIGQGRTAAEA